MNYLNLYVQSNVDKRGEKTQKKKKVQHTTLLVSTKEEKRLKKKSSTHNAFSATTKYVSVESHML